MKAVRLTRREAAQRKEENEDRLASLLEEVQGFGLEPLLLATTDRNEIYSRFMTWADLRRHAGGAPF